MEQLGRILPNAKDAEGAVLGAILIEKEAINHIIDIIKTPEIFYEESNQLIFAAVLDLYNLGSDIDIITVYERLIKNKTSKKVGGSEKATFYIASLTIKVNSAANIVTHARILVEKYIKREAIINIEKISSFCYDDGDAFEAMDKIQDLATILSDLGSTSKGYETYKDLIKQVFDYLDSRRNSGSTENETKTGLFKLDEEVGSWGRSEFVILAGRPGMGKTAAALSMINHMGIELGLNCMVFSLEMTAIELMKRNASSLAEIPSDKIREGNLSDEEWERLIEKSNQICGANIVIDESSAITIPYLIKQIKKYIVEYGSIDAVFIDYLQLMKGKENKREQEIAGISRGLKEIAKEFNITLFALAQLNRGVETRGGDKKPMLSDLRESGQIEQDADKVIFLYRPEYYKITEDEYGNSTFQAIVFIIAKNRQGGAGVEATQRFIPQYTKVCNFESGFDNSQQYEPMQNSTEF